MRSFIIITLKKLLLLLLLNQGGEMGCTCSTCDSEKGTQNFSPDR